MTNEHELTTPIYVTKQTLKNTKELITYNTFWSIGVVIHICMEKTQGNSL
jgi:hypothetical protein